MEKEIVTQCQEVQSPTENKSKKKHDKTHIQQTSKLAIKKNIKINKGKKANKNTRESLVMLTTYFLGETLQVREIKIFLKG